MEVPILIRIMIFLYKLISFILRWGRNLVLLLIVLVLLGLYAYQLNILYNRDISKDATYCINGRVFHYINGEVTMEGTCKIKQK